MYSELISIAREIVASESNFICNAANISSLLYTRLRDVNWAGFYMLSQNHLLLGPFMGKPACIQIPMGNGVCGKAAATKKTYIVPDVNSFPGHIACDNASNSEIVIPLVKRNVLYGVMDIDSPILDRFQKNDKEGLEEIAELLLEASDMESVLQYYNR